MEIATHWMTGEGIQVKIVEIHLAKLKPVVIDGKNSVLDQNNFCKSKRVHSIRRGVVLNVYVEDYKQARIYVHRDKAITEKVI